jgi:hypothetical protein
LHFCIHACYSTQPARGVFAGDGNGCGITMPLEIERAGNCPGSNGAGATPMGCLS